MPFEVR
ncbi:hypothetical protein VTL71DRAFT_1502 [Oculimacula yallundae]